MKLINERIEKDDKLYVVTKYDVDQISSKEELFEFLTEYQSTCGKIGAICCTCFDEDNRFLFKNEYNGLAEMKEDFDDEYFALYTIYRLASVEKPVELFLNVREKSFQVYLDKSGRIIDIYNEKNYKYYIFDNSFVVKRNTAFNGFYRKENGKWVELPRMMDKFIDSAYDFVEISKEEAEGSEEARTIPNTPSSHAEKVDAPNLTKIVITGGPCAGKSTAMSWIQQAFSQMGYVVLFVPETATELITGGVAPWTCNNNVVFQKCLLRLQLEKEKVFEAAARQMKAEKVLMVCDRGALDNKAYMSAADFQEVLTDLKVNEVGLRDQYDAVFHLVTAAKGAEEQYTTKNNEARKETPEQAAELDDALIHAWTGHPHFRVIDNATDFEDKMRRLIIEIAAFLGEPEPCEIERKYLIEYPDVKQLEQNPNCQKVEIIQTYLRCAGDEEVRIRQRGLDGHYIYVKTVKKKLSEVKRIEVEKRLTQDEYLTLLMEADASKKQIRKTRYCLTYEGQYFEIDVYPFWQDRAIMEIELREEGQKIQFPKEIKIIKEVTEDDRYKNSSLASNGGVVEELGESLTRKQNDDKENQVPMPTGEPKQVRNLSLDLRQTNMHEVFGESDGYDGYLYTYMFTLDCGGNSYEEMCAFVDFAQQKVMEDLKRFHIEERDSLFNDLRHIYLMIKDTRELRYLGARAKSFLDYCRERYVHLLVGGWGRGYDYYLKQGFELDFEQYPGSADDAATYDYVTYQTVIGRPEDFCENIPLAYLIREPEGSEVIYLNKKKFILGSSKNMASYLLDSSCISPVHAVIKEKSGLYYVTDAHSRESTFLNGVICLAGQWKSLKDGDKLSLAGIEFTFRVEKYPR